MKIIEANVVGGGDAYQACVVVLDEGVRYSAKGEGENPHQALNYAFGMAAKSVTEAARRNLNVRHEVVF
jgi:hypothetical protein